MKRRKIVRLAQKKELEEGMDCPFCTDRRRIPVDPDFIEQHLIVILDKAFHYHVHGPIGDKEAIKNFIFKIAKEADIEIEDNGKGEGTKDKGDRKRKERDEARTIEVGRRFKKEVKNKNIKKSQSESSEDSTIPDEPA